MRNSSASLPATNNTVHLEYGLVGCMSLVLAGAILVIFNLDVQHSLSSALPGGHGQPAALSTDGALAYRPENLGNAGPPPCLNVLCIASPGHSRLRNY